MGSPTRKICAAINIKPLYDRVVIKRTEEEKVSAGGIVIPDSATEKPIKGQAAQGFADSGFRICCHSLTSRTVLGDGDIHAVRMAVTSPVTDFSL